VDVGNKKLKIAIEIDGNSHYGEKKKQDKKKTKILEKRGWKVLRFTNQQIDKDLKKCVKMIMSII
jgi:very-short-patch-repair endonuclease